METAISFGEVLISLGRGALQTFRIVPLCVLFSLAGGMVLGIVQSRKIPVIREIINVYIVIMRGLPPLLLMMFFFFAFKLSIAFVTAVLVLSLYHTGYVAEIIRGGIEAIPKGQLEAAESLGLSSYSTMTKVVIPQIWYQIIPSLAGEYIVLVKDTALVSVIGVGDIMQEGTELMQLTYKPFEIYFLIGAFFFVICFSLQQLSGWAEKALRSKLVGSEGRA